MALRKNTDGSYPDEDTSVSAPDLSLYSAPVDWKEIRSAFIRARGRRKQVAIAKAGGLPKNAITKLESNDHYGPSVETFVHAVEGLGLSVSAFFAQIEGTPHFPLKAQPPRAHDSAIAPLPEVVHAAGVSSPVLVGVEELRSIGRIIGRAIRDAARGQPTPGARPRAPRVRRAAARRP